MVSMKLRSGPSGAVFVGENDGDTLIWSEAEQAWTTGPGGGGAAPHLSSAWVVDIGTTVPADEQTGSYGAPFSSVQDALDAAAASTAANVVVLLSPGFYQGEGALTFSAAKGLTIAALAPGLAGDAPAVLGVSYTGGQELVLANIVHGALTVSGDAKLIGTKTDAVLNVSGLLTIDGSELESGATVSAFDLVIKNATLDDAVLSPFDTCTVIATQFSGDGEVTFGEGPGAFRLDSLSWYFWDAISGVINNGSLVGLTPP